MSSRQRMRREPISLAIKNNIRLYHKENERMTVSDMVLWAEKRYGIPFLPATMRTILFPKPSKSGTLSTQLTYTDRQRERNGNWPELEIELAGWYKSCVTPPKGEEMTAKAKELWQDLAQRYYNGQNQPTFGVNWRDKFKARHGLKLKKVSDGVSLINGKLPSVNAQQRHSLLDNNSPTDANISLHADDDVLEIPVVESLSNAFAGLDYSENATLLDFSGELRSVISGDFEDNTSLPITLQSPNTSRRSMQLTGDKAQDCTLKAFTSAYQRTVSTTPQPWLRPSPQTVAHDCADPADVTEGVSRKRASEDDGSRRRSKRKRHDPFLVRNLMPPSKIQDERRPNFLIPLPFCDPERNSTIRECISSLLLKAPNGDQSVSAGSVECLIKTLVSELEVRDSPDFQQAYQSTLCSYHKAVQGRIEANRRVSVKTLKLLQLAETIKVQSPPRKDWSEWETELLFNKFFRFPSQDRDSEECDKVVSSDLNHTDVKCASYVPPFQCNHGKVHSICKNANSIFTMKSKQARVDVISSTFATGKDPGTFGITAQVILTLPSTAQMRFYLPPTTAPGYNSSLMPTLSIRKMIPNDSEIFEIAGRGTVEKLRELFSEGKASPADCDEDGRSLINYALSNHNVENFNYLVDFVKDVDTYEVSQYGFTVPLIAVMTQIVFEIPERTRERRTECFKRMLAMGADCSLLLDEGDGEYSSVFQAELDSGSAHNVEAILNSENPLITPNSLGDAADSNLSPLCFLAKCFGGLGEENFQTLRKFLFLIQKRGDVNCHDEEGWSCLHLILRHDILHRSVYGSWTGYDHEEFKLILMAIIIAGGDIKAVNDEGMSPSEVACLFGNEEVWIQALTECGCNPWEIFSFENEDLEWYPGNKVFSAGNTITRPTKLTFQEFLSQAEHFKSDKSLYHSESWSRDLMAKIRVIYGEIVDDSDDESWSDTTSCCDCSACADDCEDDEQYSQEDDYASINGDPSWLAYVSRPQYLTYWINYSSEWSDSNSCNCFDDDENLEGDNEESDEEDTDELESEYEGEDESDCEGEDDMDDWESQYGEEDGSDCEDGD